MDYPPNQTETAPSGYLSHEHKKKFTITAGILGAVFFFAQFILPFFIMVIFFIPLMASSLFQFKIACPETAVYWDDSILYTERITQAKPHDNGVTILKRVKLGQENIEDVCQLPFEDPWLLAGRERLWIIDSSAVAFYRDKHLSILSKTKRLGDITHPFLYHDQPAVIEARPEGPALLVWEENQWQNVHPIELNTDQPVTDLHENLQILCENKKLHFFLRHGDTLYYRIGQTEKTKQNDQWQTVCSTNNNWQAVWLNEGPAVFHSVSSGQEFHAKIIGLRLSNNESVTFFSHNVPIVSGMGVCPLAEPDKFAVMLQSFPGSIRILVADGPNVASEKRYGSEFPFPRGFFFAMFIPQMMTFCIPLILALILSGLMRKYRICYHHAGPLTLPFASLARRAMAQVIDFVFVGGPGLLGYLLFMFSIFDMEEALFTSPFIPLGGLILFFVGAFWVLASLVLFSFLEGKYGATPGKWVMKIRVIGTDLQHCGFGRALVRNLLKLVDGFFNFMVGVMIVALSDNWQRVGDMAARTVVIDIRKTGNHSATSVLQTGQY